MRGYILLMPITEYSPENGILEAYPSLKVHGYVPKNHRAVKNHFQHKWRKYTTTEVTMMARV
jgi:hypothetical protein